MESKGQKGFRKWSFCDIATATQRSRNSNNYNLRSGCEEGLTMPRGSARRKISALIAGLKSRPLRVDILTAFVSLLVITVLIIVLYTYEKSAKAVFRLSDDIINKVKEMVIRQTTDFLAPASTLADLNSLVASRSGFSLPENEELESYGIEIIKAYPQFAMVDMADEKGNFLMPKRMPDGTIATKIINRNVVPPTVTWKYRNNRGEVIESKSSHEVDYDPRARPWYQGAKETRTMYWTDMYIFFSDRVPGITAAYPVINKVGEFVGAVGLDIELGSLSAFLKTLKIGETGIAFIINRRKEVVAFPDVTQIVKHRGEALGNVGIQELGAEWITRFLNEWERTGKTKFSLEAGGVRYLGTVADFPESFEHDWKIVILVPEDDFVGPVKKAHTVSVLLSLIILLVAVGCAALLSRNISRPILLLTDETEKIKGFELDDKLEIKSYIKEIQLMADALTRMKASLRSFTRFAPEEIVREVVAKGREALLGGDKREVTLMFCDLRGFTHHSEKIRPEEVVAQLNEHFDAMVRIIARHGGFVCDFLGDSVFAVFGAPVVDQDHARHAISCAVEMQLARLQMNTGQRNPRFPALEMGIGLNTGTCVVGNMGSQMRIKYGVVGHAVNVASRIESFSVGGQVLISETTHAAVADLIVSAGPYQAFGKGVGEAILVWEVRSIREAPSLSLPPAVPGLVELSRPVVVTLHLVSGKRLSPEGHKARMTRLSDSGAEIDTDQDLGMFSPIHLQIAWSPGTTVPIDARVVGMGERIGVYVVRFSGVDAATAEVVRKLLAQSA
jgi:adenylate cyclase